MKVSNTLSILADFNAALCDKIVARDRFLAALSMIDPTLLQWIKQLARP
jgi:hypothetical protein